MPTAQGAPQHAASAAAKPPRPIAPLRLISFAVPFAYPRSQHGLAPAEIDWARAAGNYVELHGHFGSILDRRTLAALADELAPHGFVRIHRSRIVRTAAIRSLESKPSGDFDVTVGNGEVVGGSRRFRSNLP